MLLERKCGNKQKGKFILCHWRIIHQTVLLNKYQHSIL